MRLSEMESGEITREEFEILFHGGIIRREKFGESALTRAHTRITVQNEHART
jgi:hypothetical protein